MSKINFFRILMIAIFSLLLASCKAPDFKKLKPDFSLIQAMPSLVMKPKVGSTVSGHTTNNTLLTLGDILDKSLASVNKGSDFITALKYALDTDPELISKRLSVEAKLTAVEIAQAQKDFQVGTTIYGGIEDITDNTKGLALSLNAKRLIFDGGELDSQIASRVYAAEAANMELSASIDQRANELCQKWLELEKYKSLQMQVDRRLAVLEPLIDQLEKVAAAGIGDVSRVTAAQRTVSAIRVEKTRISEGLAQAELEFSNTFGSIDSAIAFDYDFISKLVPAEITDKMVQNSPLLKSHYASYQSAAASARALKAKDGFDVGLEARAMRPFAGSEYDSDESIGLVGRKTLFNGGMLESEIMEAEALVEAAMEQVKATYRYGSRSVQAAVQNIESMEKAILIARESAELTSDEIVYLRQQLVIGGSTLDSVLSAEARLYEAESREIKMLTEKYKSKLLIVSSMGLFSKSIGY